MLPEQPTIGILGLGAFGRLMAASLAPHLPVIGFDPGANRLANTGDPGALFSVGTLEQACGCDVVVLAVNLQHLREAIDAAAPHLHKDSLVLDVCSVKLRPVELLGAHLPESVEILGTHPLFGPQTVREKGLKGQPIALCPVRSAPETYRRVRTFLADVLGLNTIEVSADEHDRQMAMVQVITHLVGHAANEMDLPELPLATLAYRRLLQLKVNTQGDSEEMFRAIQNVNPYAADTRRRFLQAMRVIGDKADEGLGPGNGPGNSPSK